METVGTIHRAGVERGDGVEEKLTPSLKNWGKKGRFVSI